MNAVVLVIGVAAAAASLADDPSRSQWTDGIPGIMAEIAAGASIPAAGLACANCHGFDAAGGGEGAVLAPDLGQSALIARGYDPTSFTRAVRSGLRPDGSTLARGMPRFGIDDDTGSRLFDQLAALEAERRIGIAPDRIVFAVAFDPEDRFARTLADAYRQEAVSLPGVFGRRIELVARPVKDAESARQATGGIVAVLGMATTRSDILHAFRSIAVPLIHPLIPRDTVHPPQVPAQSPEPVLLGLSLEEELAKLARHARADGIDAVRLASPPPQHAHLLAPARAALSAAGIAIVPDAEAVLLLAADDRTLRSLALPAKAPVLAPAALIARLASEIEALELRAVAVDPLPALAHAGTDPYRAYAAASLAFVVRSLADAGRDVTRRTLVEAARARRSREVGER